MIKVETIRATVQAAPPSIPYAPPVEYDLVMVIQRTGLTKETALATYRLALTLTELVEPGVLSLGDALARLSWGPAAIAGLTEHGRTIEVGEPANICVIDPALAWEVDATRLASRARNTPYEGRSLTGKVRHTICRGEAVVVDGEAQR